ncbi:MAG: hypothetical protein ABI955_00335 [Nitrospirota bacterium]
MNIQGCSSPTMRGDAKAQITMYNDVSLEVRVPASTPLPSIKAMAGEVLTTLSPTFEQMYCC